DESLSVEERAHRARDRVALAQALAHELAPQVEVAVAQPHFLAGGLVELERQRIRTVEDRKIAGYDLDLARGPVCLCGALRARAPAAPESLTELVADPLAGGEPARGIRLAHHLHQALAIAQVDEDHAAVVAAPVHPAGHGDLPADQAGGHLSAVMCAHGAIPG